GKNPGITQRNTNTVDQGILSGTRDEFITATLFKKSDIDPDVPEQPQDYEQPQTSDSIEDSQHIGSDEKLEESISLVTVSSSVIDSCHEEDGFDYILGWIAFKLKKSHPDLGDKTKDIKDSLNPSHMPSFIANLSYGGLMVPSPEFKVMGKAMEKVFILSHVVVKKFVKIRTIVRMRYCNLLSQGLIQQNAYDDQKPSTSKRRFEQKSHVANKYKKLCSQ
ncbi:uncharacterized protein LOC129753942, partial [Uranotaenia lowii]|uniref:uncharacterized protein LOC129753942 n=1 Tax=Uranotaenia lowii TaxID=190385 RepID=UPI0024785908